MKRIIKRILLIVVIVFVGLFILGIILNALGVGNAGQGSSSSKSSSEPAQESTATATPEATEEPTPEQTPVETQEATPTPTVEPTPEETPIPTAEETPEPTPEQTSGPAHQDSPLKSGNYDLPSGIQITYSDSVRNDSTGNWRKSLIADSRPISDYAMEYYGAMMADDEVHAVVNFTLNTTTCFNAMSGVLFVDTYEYVNGEEHDANKLFSGQLLTSDVIDLSTGQPLEIDE